MKWKPLYAYLSQHLIIISTNKKFNILYFNLYFVQKRGRISLIDIQNIRVDDLNLNRKKDCLPTCVTIVLEHLKDMIISKGFKYKGKIPHNFDIGFWKKAWKKFFSEKSKHYIFGEDITEFVYNDITKLLKDLNLYNEIGWRYTTRQRNPIQKITSIINKDIPPIVIVDPDTLYNTRKGTGSHAIILLKKEGSVFYFYDPAKPTAVNHNTASIELLTKAHEARKNAFMFLYAKRLYESININVEQAILTEEGFGWEK